MSGSSRRITLKSKLALVGALAVAVSSFAPATMAGAQDESAASESGSKTVIESETGSYIVVMAADALTATIAADDLDTPAAEAQAAVLEESHDEVLAEAGIDAADKVQDYTNSLNGFSAVLSHAEATELAAEPEGGVRPARRDAPSDHRLERRVPRPDATRRGVQERADR